MPLARCKRPTLKRPAPSPAQGPVSPGPESAPAPILNDLFQEFLRTYIKRIQDQALAALAAPAAEARDDTNKHFKPQNPDLYYGYLHMECYYFYQQCKDHFEVVESLGHKLVLFVAGFGKDRILNR